MEIISQHTDGGAPAAAKNNYCVHCYSPLPVTGVFTDGGGRAFCCLGCRTIYTAIQSCDLGEYYKIRDQFLSQAQPTTLVKAQGEKFAYLDAAEIRQQFETADGQMFFFITGIQCAACVWILEKISQVAPNIQSVHVDAARQLAAVKLESGGQYADFASWAQVFGYSVRPVQLSENLELLTAQNRRSDLRRIGVAAVCAGNIMLLSTSIYLGADAAFERLFNWVSLALTIPVLFYGALPMLRGAWGAFRARVPTLDLPIVVAVFGGFILSVYQLAFGQGRVYFDSISILVLLILSSRYFVNRMQEKFLAYEGDAYSLLPLHARRVLDASTGVTQLVAAQNLKLAEQVQVSESEKIPGDGRVVSGSAWVRESVLTGEPFPRAVVGGSEVFAGTTVEAGSITIELTAIGADTRLGELQTSSTTSALLKSQVTKQLEAWAQKFTYFVMAVGLTVCLYFLWHGAWAVGFERMLSLFIVACPCALAFGAPLIFSKALMWAAKHGVFFRSADVFAKLNNVQNLVFDKTGTLTFGRLELFSGMQDLAPAHLAAIVAIENRVAHPIAQSLVTALGPLVDRSDLPAVTDLQLMPGQGVRARVEGELYELMASDANLSVAEAGAITIWVDVKFNGQIIAHLGFRDQIRDEAVKVLLSLRSIVPQQWVLSGDRIENVKAVGRVVGIPENHLFAKQRPEEKEAHITRLPCAMMIGDGVNDARAMARAQVAVIVGGALERALKVADVFLTQEGLSQLPLLWRLKTKTDKAFRRVRYFSVTYNFMTGLLAVTGLINPLVAAILMPISSISVLLISLLSVRENKNKSFDEPNHMRVNDRNGEVSK